MTGVLDYYRLFFDQLKNDEQSYTDDRVTSLPPACVAGRDITLTVVPLICFHIVKWHQSDWVMRQFGFDQPIPRRSHQPNSLHLVTFAGRHDKNWSAIHIVYITAWDSRREKLVRGTPLQALLTTRSEYMRWYKRITRRWVSTAGASIGNAADIAEHWFSSTNDDATREAAAQILHLLQEHDRIIIEHLRLTPATDDIAGPPEESSAQGSLRRRRRGLAISRTQLRHPEDSISTSQPMTRHRTTITAATTPDVTATYLVTELPPTYHPP